MKWYIAKLIFNITIDNRCNCSQFDEQLRLIEAVSATDAFLKARMIGSEQEETFLNKSGEKITWKFIDVSDIQPLQELKHGVEIYSSTVIDEEPDNYISFVKQKAPEFENKNLLFEISKN